MFNNNKFITEGVQKTIPSELQLFMWNCIDILKGQGHPLDYIQVFELTSQRADDIFFQKICHRQEVPEYSKTYSVFSTKMVDEKVFVIDDGIYSTMLLAEEY